ncbi:hypothetical protein Tsubulata_032145 [Turnera subulata]|uniref:KIB1-4 beta-propeller domain-containing protein n=1 Tax=Turnera subulata TaxID=218843 RepID=A0A9Q0IZ23_9ROSI|nr:hypothetical protein Tsubulata_032145 [Turnera subulata]
MDSTPPESWSDLPSVILEKIANCYKSSRLYVLRFRGVCRSWRSSIPPLMAILYPLKLPYPIHPDPNLPVGHYILKEATTYSIQPLSDATVPPWILQIESSESEGNAIFKCMLPRMSRAERKSACHFPKVIDLLQFRVNEMCNDHLLDAVVEWPYPHVIGAAVASGSSETANGFTVMAVDKKKFCLGVWRMGDDRWSIISDHTVRDAHFTRVKYIRRKFYAFAHNGLAVTIDPDSLKITQVAPPKQQSNYVSNSESIQLLGVVESFGNIFGVYEYTHYRAEGKTVRIQVETLEEETKEWIRAGDEMKDSVAFIGSKYSFSVLAKDMPGYKANSIYFDHCYGYGYDPEPPATTCGHPGSKYSIYEVENGHISALCGQSGCSPSFWRPPSWLNL